jgi:hypothetical protein
MKAKAKRTYTWAIETYDNWSESETWNITGLCADREDAAVIAHHESTEDSPCRVVRIRTDYTLLEYVGNDLATAAKLRRDYEKSLLDIEEGR